MAQKRGTTVREGGEPDLGTFFHLMVDTCRRQQTPPNPATVASVRQIWASFHPRGRFRLTLAEYEGEAVAGALCLCFGNRMTIWKKGWSGRHHERKPNHLIMFEALTWAHRRGYQLLDCVGMSREIAETVLGNRPLSEDQKRDRASFFLGFGGRPVLLPDARIYVRNPLARISYRLAIATSVGRRGLRWASARTMAA